MPNDLHRHVRGWPATVVRLVICALCWGVALAGLAAAPAHSAPTLPANFQDSLVSAADRPTGLAFTPDGRLLIAGEAGTVSVFRNGVLKQPPALDISARTCSDQERGMMAVEVDPAFASNHYIYVYYTYNKAGVCEYGSDGSTRLPVNRVSRFVLADDDTVNPAGEVVLIDNIPAPEGYHIGADLHFGKDGYLYASTGDGGCDYADPVWCDAYNDAARDRFVLLGKVLRITRDGAIPPSNPYQGADSARCNTAGRTDPGKKCQETFAEGLRNPFRMAFDPNAAGTRFFINDVGDITWEEVDVGQAGADYGWNLREGPCAVGSTTDCGSPPAGLTNPIHSYAHSTGCMSITGGAFVPDAIWPAAYDGTFLYGDLSCGKMFKLMPIAGGGYSVSDFASGFGGYSLVSMTFGPSGSGQALYYITLNGPGSQVRRISYTGPPRGYARPKGATPVYVSLVPAHRACAAPNTVHAGPLAFPSCKPAVPASSQLTVGTPDANGRAAGSVGHVSLAALTGDPATTADEADVALALSLTDVRRASDLSDYAGELQASTKIRVTDKRSGSSGTEAATTSDFTFAFTVPCAVTADTTTGASCVTSTSADAVMPGAVAEGKRALWQLDRIEVYDGGPDGQASTAGNSLFATQGLFAP